MKEANVQEIWQIDAGGQIYEADFQELTQWIFEGSLLPQDKVRRGNLRWIEARKVPLLIQFFNAKEQGEPMPFIATTTAANISVENNFTNNGNAAAVPTQTTEFFIENNQIPIDINQAQDFCIIHTELPAKYSCETCLNVFCKDCPSSFGSNVKICPMCGAMCKPLITQPLTEPQAKFFDPSSEKKFGFTDFGSALIYPLKFKASYVLGALMFMFFTLGQQASAIGGIMMFSASLTCFMLANMLTFGILANIADNFSQGKIGGNFMPSFEDFSLWEDIINPFFLSIGIYLVSFGLMILLIIGAAWYMVRNVSENVGNKTFPGMQSQTDTAKQLPQYSQTANKINEQNLYRDGEMPSENQIANSQIPAINREEDEFREMEKMINDTRKQQFESVAGKSPEEESAQMREAVTSMLKTGGIFIVLIFLAFLWGIFYFPAACMVAGYTRSFGATINPSVGFDTIKRLGADYFKILGMGFILLIMSGIFGLILNIIFLPFNLPKLGNLPAIAVGSWFTFYMSIVFSLILGFALYKNAGKMNLFRR